MAACCLQWGSPASGSHGLLPGNVHRAPRCRFGCNLQQDCSHVRREYVHREAYAGELRYIPRKLMHSSSNGVSLPIRTSTWPLITSDVEKTALLHPWSSVSPSSAILMQDRFRIAHALPRVGSKEDDRHHVTENTTENLFNCINGSTIKRANGRFGSARTRPTNDNVDLGERSECAPSLMRASCDCRKNLRCVRRMARHIFHNG